MSQRVKIFTVLMAVMLCMSCMCMTAFAAETDLPPGAQMVTNGGSISSADAISLDTPYVVVADGVESITIDGLFYFSKIHGWNGSAWIEITAQIGDVADSVTFAPADYPEYTYFTVQRGDTMASSTITFSWVQPSQTEIIVKPVPSIAESLLAVVVVMMSLVSSQALAMLPVYIGLVFVGILLAVSLIRNR